MDNNKELSNIEETNKILQLVRFRVGSEQYGLDILRVLEIIRMPPITRVPQAPPIIDGVINLRGRVIPIINTRRRFGLEEKESDSDSRIVIVEISGDHVGLVVDAVQEVLRIQQTSVEAPPQLAHGAEYISGISRLDDSLLILLDLTELAAEAAEVTLEANRIREGHSG
ncbi:MAG: chemotaxis protein CheW [FCB group bacterium]|nr:chemotaxis protein CheW [FCB group bacterium]